MKIVVLDGFCLNPGDLSWELLGGLGKLEVHDRTSSEDVVTRAAGAEIILTNKVRLTREAQAQLPELRYIGVLATGYDIVDVIAARERGITVTNVPSYGTDSVAQSVFALLLALCHRVELHSESARAGEWSRNPDFCYWMSPLVELAGKTMGIVGLGRIGRKTAQIADALGMRVVAAIRTDASPPPNEGFRFASVEDLLRASDVVSLHAPLTEETRGLINAERLALMKPTAFLINTARGALVVERDLARALNESRLAGAGVDVLSTEPPVADNPLLAARNCIVTPHIAWATREARTRLMDIAMANVKAFVSGAPENVVS